MSDRREAYLCAVGHEEDVFVDNKNTICQFHISMELDELCGSLDNALHYLLAIPPHRVTLHLEDGASSNHFGGLYILECNITPQDTTCTDDCPEICSGREIIFLNKSLALLALAICHLLKSFMLSLTVFQTHPSSLGSRCANQSGAFQRTGQGDQTAGNGQQKLSQIYYHM